MNLEGIIPLLGGTYALLLAFKILPRTPKDPVKWNEWHQKWGTALKVLGPIVIVFGIMQLLGLL